MSAAADYARITRLLLHIRDRIELAGRVPGDRILHTRRDDDATIDDVGIIARLIRRMAEHDRE